MWFETVRIHFLSEFSVCCQNILLPWQRDVTTSITSTPIVLPSFRIFSIERGSRYVRCHGSNFWMKQTKTSLKKWIRPVSKDFISMYHGALVSGFVNISVYFNKLVNKLNHLIDCFKKAKILLLIQSEN